MFGWVVKTTLRQIYHRECSVLIVQGAGWGTGPLWTKVENFACIGIRTWAVQPVSV